MINNLEYYKVFYYVAKHKSLTVAAGELAISQPAVSQSVKQLENIKAILFDSGRVLNGPVTGHWFVTPNFWDYVNKDIFNVHKSSNQLL